MLRTSRMIALLNRLGGFMDSFDPKTISSCHINFLFGAGVNGSSFPQLRGFKKTLAFLDENAKDRETNSFEKKLDSLPNELKQKAKDLFVKEFKDKEKSIDFKSKSIANIRHLINSIYVTVDKSENRINAMKQINIFTTNYDFIVEETIRNEGFLCNHVSATNLKNNERFFNIVGYDLALKKNVPTFLVSKIHGEIDNPILPGNDKYDAILEANKFEIVFKMKEKLMRFNSILFVIGYAGNDEHLNRILKDCVGSGLVVYWFKYSESDFVPPDLKDKIEIIENPNNDDTTLLCADWLDKLWEE